MNLNLKGSIRPPLGLYRLFKGRPRHLGIKTDALESIVLSALFLIHASVRLFQDLNDLRFSGLYLIVSYFIFILSFL